jgi:hypothetical protein
MKTIIALRNRQLGDRHFDHAAEIDPGLLEGDLLDYWLDRKWAMETLDRRSLYQLFPAFSGCTHRQELAPNELARYGVVE